MNKDIQFLKELQKELNTQDYDSQAAPRFWVVGDYIWVSTLEGNAQRYSVCFPEEAEVIEIEDYLKTVQEDEELPSEAREAMADIECELSALDWIHDYVDNEAYLIPEEKVHHVHPNTMFLTKEEAKRHIKSNHYHYSPEAHTYAMTAWRAPKVERLVNILETFDWNAVELYEDKGVTK